VRQPAKPLLVIETSVESPEEVILQQRRLTLEQKTQQAEHFLSFKSQRGLKRVNLFTDHYRLN